MRHHTRTPPRRSYTLPIVATLMMVAVSALLLAVTVDDRRQLPVDGDTLKHADGMCVRFWYIVYGFHSLSKRTAQLQSTT